LDLLPRIRERNLEAAVIVLTAHGSVDLAVQAMQEGADHFLTKPVDLPALLVVLERALGVQRIRRSALVERTRGARAIALDPFAGESSAIKRLEADARKLAGTDRPVLIQGETGSGKGVLASWLHKNGPRADEPFVDLNCAGLSKDLLESELFGHEAGAFTGAVGTKQGLFDLAHGGTFFLDEIGDVDPLVQPKLLKVLEEKRYRRLGDTKDRVSDARLVAATHHDLQGLVRERRFREDLYFRIATFVVRIPALRERREDVPVLARGILGRVAQEMGRPGASLADDALQALAVHPFPGNIRELKNLLERTLLLSEGSVIRAADLRFESGAAAAAVAAAGAPDDLDLTLDELESRHVERVLQAEEGNVERAAKRLGVTRNTLYYKLRKRGGALKN
ncbi:MAG TPA: sigma-54 dependent transcriptional regulator, partial [Thermoanaerobaculia bacterium]|nr:sigma-54 dependent transcriptional regulator [Thermoanaerobaculia bacterium]